MNILHQKFWFSALQKF